MAQKEERSVSKKASNTSISEENLECKVCHEPFSTLQDVLKHELLNHSASNNNTRKTPVNQLKRRVNAVLKTINAEDEKKLRQELFEAISDSQDGKELSVIFKKNVIGNDELKCIFTRIHNSLQEELDRIGSYYIQEYGSIANGLALKSSDIDLHISGPPKIDPNSIYKNITRMLFRSKQFSDIIPIRKARVPIIKCVHIATGFSLDINTTEPYAVYNSAFIHKLIICDNRIHQLMLFLKIWSKSMHIYGAFNMTNYCLVTLVIFYLQNHKTAVLSSIKILQKNAPKIMVHGINFGLNTRCIPIDNNKSIHQLIKGFFEFYNGFDFEKYIIAPYLAKIVNKSDFKSKVYQYPEYEAQMQMFKDTTGESPEELQSDRPVVVQDMFCLNINVAKGITETNIQYLKKCINMAYRKCSEPNITLKKLYKSLLVNMVEELGEMFPLIEQTAVLNSSSGGGLLSFDIIPRKNELKSLAKFADNPLNLQKLWAKEYIDAVVQIVTEIYRVDMTLLSPTHYSKLKKTDEADELPIPCKWSINSYVDLWSGRQMLRNNVSFMEYQLAQTEKLHNDRRQKANFAVQFKGYITITVSKNYNSLHVEASSTETLCKKNPLRKFFGALKCCMQNYNLKQRIHEIEGQNLKGEINN